MNLDLEAFDCISYFIKFSFSFKSNFSLIYAFLIIFSFFKEFDNLKKNQKIIFSIEKVKKFKIFCFLRKNVKIMII